MKRALRPLFFFLCVVLLAPLNSASGQGTTPTPIAVSDDAVNAVSRNLYCPVCQNVTLEVCPTDACARWREQVRELLAQGKSEEEVRQYFIDKFGMRTVGAPVDTLGRLLTIGVPFGLIVIIGALLAVRVYRRRGPAGSSPDEPDTEETPESISAELAGYREQLEAELKERQ